MASAAEPREPQPERQPDAPDAAERQAERPAAPVIAIEEIAAPPVEPRKLAAAGPNRERQRSRSEAQGGLVEQARLRTQGLKLAAFDGETPPSNAVGFQPGSTT